MQAEELIE